MQLVREQANPGAHGRADVSRVLRAVENLSARRRDERGKNTDQRGLSRPVGSEEPQNLAAPDAQRDVRQRAAAPEVARDVEELNGIEVGAHAARPARPRGPGPESSLSSAP